MFFDEFDTKLSLNSSDAGAPPVITEVAPIGAEVVWCSRDSRFYGRFGSTYYYAFKDWKDYGEINGKGVSSRAGVLYVLANGAIYTQRELTNSDGAVYNTLVATNKELLEALKELPTSEGVRGDINSAVEASERKTREVFAYLEDVDVADVVKKECGYPESLLSGLDVVYNVASHRLLLREILIVHNLDGTTHITTRYYTEWAANPIPGMQTDTGVKPLGGKLYVRTSDAAILMSDAAGVLSIIGGQRSVGEPLVYDLDIVVHPMFYGYFPDPEECGAKEGDLMAYVESGIVKADKVCVCHDGQWIKMGSPASDFHTDDERLTILRNDDFPDGVLSLRPDALYRVHQGNMLHPKGTFTYNAEYDYGLYGLVAQTSLDEWGVFGQLARIVSLYDLTNWSESLTRHIESARTWHFDRFWEASGGEVDRAGHPEAPYGLNGLWLTYEEAVVVAADTQYHVSGVVGRTIKGRTNFEPPFTASSGGLTNFQAPRVEVLNVGTRNYASSFTGWLVDAPKIVSIIGIIDLTYFNGSMGNCLRCPKLAEVKFYGLKRDFNIRYLAAISLESLTYLVNNAANGEAIITVTVHPDVYAKLTDEANAEWFALLTAAIAKNISFASAE
ncbi:MAG: hypothetical protein K2I18_08570 [Paramuribaculum sp.]|nr:hypothetical protein [Paramuribaculum sp.]